MFINKSKLVPTPPYEINNSSLRENSQNFRGNPGKRMDCFVAKNVNAPRNDGFTLAEVLITLVIIGVIAAITVPTLITKYQKEQTVTRLKKAYSALSQTTNRAIADNGPIETWEVDISSTKECSSQFYQKYLRPYLRILKDCGTTTTGDCKFNFKLGQNPSYFGDTVERFYLDDGSFIALQCDTYSDGRLYFEVSIDINGQKKPNNYGKDIFIFYYWVKGISKNGKFTPYGMNSSRDVLLNDPNYGCKSALQRAEFCTTLIFKDGWRIADDYPW